MKQKRSVAIIDLVVNKPGSTFYSRLINSNCTSIMPQVIAVWLEQAGHEVFYTAYTGFEDLTKIPLDIDILFVSSFTHTAYSAYGLSHFFRKQGVITVLGGPHTRSYADDARKHFDYVIGLADKTLIYDLLQDLPILSRRTRSKSKHPRGLFVSAKTQPQTLPGIKERWRFIQQTLKETRLIHIATTIGSLGCPYKCSFCIDSKIRYQPLPYDQIYEDLTFVQKQPQVSIVGWYDPNFGVRFNDYMNVIESVVRPGRLKFIAECSLKQLTEPHVKRLASNGFVVLLPGVDSWTDFNRKSGLTNDSVLDKVRIISEQANMIMQYIPCLQLNFIFGLDSDEGRLPFELTKELIRLAPGVYPNFSPIVSYGNSSPLSCQYEKEGRVIDIPFYFLDGCSCFNIVLKNYHPIQFYDYFVDLIQYAFSPNSLYKRFKANKYWSTKGFNLLRSITSDKGLRASKNHMEFRERLKTDHTFQEFYSKDTYQVPEFFWQRIKKSKAPFLSLRHT